MFYDLNNAENLKVLILDWEQSPGHLMQVIGRRYYYGDHDIRHPELPAGKTRYTLINGVRHVMTGVVNNILVDNMYAQMVQQKVNYLFSKPLLVEGENREYKKILQPYFGREFLATIKKLATEMINCGIAYVYPYYTPEGNFDLEIFSGEEILPIWRDRSHKYLEAAIRVHHRQSIEGGNVVLKKYATVFLPESTKTYEILKDSVVFLLEKPYLEIENPLKHVSWGRIPLIPFRPNSEEIPLIQRCKSIQDNLNYLESTYLDVLEETGDTTLLAVSGGGVENPLELRKNITEHRLMYLQNVPGIDADVKAIQMEVKKENFEYSIRMLRKAMVENCNGFEMKDERIMGSHINDMNIKSMYVNLDLDANNIETEFQRSIYNLLYFFNKHFETHHMPTVNVEDITILTDRDNIVNLEAQVHMASQLYQKVSLKTFLSMLSTVDNVDEEYDRIMQEGTYQLNLSNQQSTIDFKEKKAGKIPPANKIKPSDDL